MAQLIESGSHTEPPAAVRLAELRQVRQLSQAEVACRAGIKQSAVARIEGRNDVLLSTLNRIVSAMGGRLLIRVEFTDGTFRDLSGLVSPRSDEPVEAMGGTRQQARTLTGSRSVQVKTKGDGATGSVRRTKPGGTELIVGAEDVGGGVKPRKKGPGKLRFS